MKKEVGIDLPVPHPKEAHPAPRHEEKEERHNPPGKINLVIIYIIFLPLLIIAYVLNFQNVTGETTVAAIGFNIGFILAILMPALLIWKQM